MKDDLPSRLRLALGTAALVAVTGAVIVGVIDGGTENTEPPTRSGPVELVAYDSCDSALEEMKERLLPYVGPFGLDFGGRGTDMGSGEVADGDAAEGGAAGEAKAAAPQAQDEPRQQEKKEHSTTNNHEAAADEPDLVKTDGERVVTVADGALRVVDVSTRRETATVPIEGGYGSQLLLSGDRALVMVQSGMAARPGVVEPDGPVREKPGSPPVGEMPYESRLVLVDLTGSGAVLGTLDLDGVYLDARQSGTVARIVVRSAPRLGFAYPADGMDEAKASYANRNVVDRSNLEDWLPRYRLTVGAATTSGQLTQCEDLRHPADYTGSAMLTVLTVDLRRDLGNGDPLTIVADGNTVYGNGKSLYVADDHSAIAEGPSGVAARTEIYQFDVTGEGQPKHVASGAVSGTLLNQYSLSELDGNLRVATTLVDERGSHSAITVLTRDGEALTQLGRVDGLGPGERIYAVRYFGTTAYVVTFRETDPLYTVDLSNPAQPVVTGELKITGYSAYLHPVRDGRLVGVGQEATTDGQRTGAQVSLFDTTEPSGARRIAQFHLANTTSDVEGDAHAFLYWPKDKLLVLPVSGGGTGGSGALVLRLSGDTFEQLALIVHDNGVVPRRALVIGDELWTVSDTGMMVHDVRSLAEVAWLAYA